jgi:hypothetical protein
MLHLLNRLNFCLEYSTPVYFSNIFPSKQKARFVLLWNESGIQFMKSSTALMNNLPKKLSSLLLKLLFSAIPKDST